MVDLVQNTVAASRTQTESVSSRIIEAIAEREGVSPPELDDRLYDAIEPDALDSLVRSLNEGAVSFQFADRTVTVESGGAITITS